MPRIPDDHLFDHEKRVSGKVTLITGGGSGIRRTTAVEFAKRGAIVIVGDINPEGAEKTAAGVKGFGGIGQAVRCDYTSWDDLVALFKFAHTTCGALDVVVLNAGVPEAGDFERTNERQSPGA
ncbi:hypothetical protein HYDPIDRAFT_28238 [Hydnomerulius pinastri MD-312]|uniref:Uncharacterized protein n=1 Tax=Hydnomerulius pinastri MD-312 TaxID=994086 RepID=A0A0C9VGZ9_9AGAM|nr:hypothetical protein HYDPIDRAFT_28238 [Hydnomerulius pinastri MD-312]